MAPPEHTRLHVVGYASVAIERAARRDDILSVDAETHRLLARFPDCQMPFEELRERIIVLATRRGVRMQLEPS